MFSRPGMDVQATQILEIMESTFPLCFFSPPCTYCRVLKVVEAVVGQDEPPSLPRLHPATCERKGRDT